MKILEKLAESLASGEVVAVVLGAVGTWVFTVSTTSSRRRRENDAELGRLKFKQENAEATRLAIREELHDLKTELSPLIAGLKTEIEDLRRWVTTVDSRADQALKVAEILERTQAQWLARAETAISAILSADNPTLARNLFRDSEPLQK